jgi:periplasmic protein TonB
MEKQSLLTADYLDILYDNRNKTYGGYELRKHYAARANKAMLSVLFMCSAVICLSLIKKKDAPADHVSFAGVHTVADIAREIELPKPVVRTPPAAPKADAIKSAIPKIVADTRVDPKDVIPDIRDLSGKAPGTETTTGSGTGGPAEGTTKPGEGTESVKETVTAPRWFASIMPDFNGALNSYLNSHLRYPPFARENGIEGRVVVEFVVNEDGSVSNASVKKGIGGGCDEEALRVVNSMPKWKPGKQNDRNVKVYMLLPIVFRLE